MVDVRVPSWFCINSAGCLDDDVIRCDRNRASAVRRAELGNLCSEIFSFSSQITFNPFWEAGLAPCKRSNRFTFFFFFLEHLFSPVSCSQRKVCEGGKGEEVSGDDPEFELMGGGWRRVLTRHQMAEGSTSRKMPEKQSLPHQEANVRTRKPPCLSTVGA